MLIRGPLVMAVLIFAETASAQASKHFISTSRLIEVTTDAAKAEGYKVGKNELYLQELRTSEGAEPISGYESVALYRGAHPVRYYSVRIDTGDVVDPMSCEILEFPRLAGFQRRIRMAFRSKRATLDQIAGEIGCDHLKRVR